MSKKRLTVEEIQERIKRYEKVLQDPEITPSKRNSARTYLAILRKRLGIKGTKKRKPAPEPDPVPEEEEVPEPETYICGVAPARKTRHEMIQDLWRDEREKNA